jgi:hypothetical protein
LRPDYQEARASLEDVKRLRAATLVRK